MFRQDAFAKAAPSRRASQESRITATDPEIRYLFAMLAELSTTTVELPEVLVGVLVRQQLVR